MKLATQGKRVRRSIRAQGSWWGRCWLKILESIPADHGLYMRWPGERVPGPRPWSGPHWRGNQSDWELAA
jgi:hypothetical protein